MRRKRILSFLLSLMVMMSSADLSGVLTLQAQAAEEQITLSADQISGKSASGHGAELAVDGDLSTYYLTPETSSNYDYMRFVDIDLQGLYEVTEIVLYNIDGSYNHYQIYASEDGEAYDKIAYKNTDEMPDVENGEQYTFETPVQASKLRINLSYNSSGMQGNLAEIKIFGTKTGEIESSEAKEITVANFEDTEWKAEWDKFENDTDYAHSKTVQEMGNLVGRVIGEEWKDDFVFEVKEFSSENDTYEIENGENGKIIIRGNNGIAMASGFNHYLKYYCKVDYNPLYVSNLDMPETLPAVDKKIVKETQYDVRYALNFCTYSYTMSFWDWDEYEEFLDWAAMSGINLILDIVGQEEIIRRVLLEYGYTDEEIKEYICGPAYFAWFYMQNMTSYGGPLPDDWFEERVELGRKIHDRMQTYGISPALSGFSGMVPTDFSKKNTDATIVTQGKWSGFTRPGMLRVYVEDGKRDYFDELADAFYQAQKDVYGDVTDYYAVDPFHEGGKTGDMDPTTVYTTVQNKMLEHDPDGIWVMQQWSGSVSEAELAGLTQKEHALILDLGSNSVTYASRMEKYQIPWVWNMLHAFGGKLGMEADVETISQNIPEAYENYNYMTGIGMTAESLERCPMIYELLWEMAWTKDPIDPMQWGKDYMERRYGAVNDELVEAWTILLNSVYDVTSADIAESLTNARPTETFKSTSSWGHGTIDYDVLEVEKALKIYIDNYEQFKDSECYIYDMADMARQVLSNSSIDYHSLMMEAYYAKDIKKFEEYSEHFLELIQLQNDVLETSDFFQTGIWLEEARTMIEDADDWTRDLFEFNARCLITTWAGDRASNSGKLRDYSYRQWAGITEDFYLLRWEMWIENYRTALKNETEPESVSWFTTEWKWVNRKSDEGYEYPTESTTEDKLCELSKLVYDSYSVKNIAKIAREFDTAGASNLLSGKLPDTENNLTEAELKSLTDGDTATGWLGENSDWPVQFTYDLGGTAEIDEISFTLKPLVANGIPVTYKVEGCKNGNWETLAEDTSGNIAGQITITCSESIQQLRLTFDSEDEAEVPELKEIEAIGMIDEVVYVNAAKGIIAEASATLERPISYLTDENISTVWLLNNGNSTGNVTLTLDETKNVGYIELYMEKAGLRFLFDVYGINAQGEEELIFSKGATGADMPAMYSIPVDKELAAIRVDYLGRDTGGKYYAAAFGFGEIKIFADSEGYAAEEIPLTNIAENGTATAIDLRTNEMTEAKEIIDQNLSTRKEYSNSSYDFIPAEYTVDLLEPAYVENVTTYFEKAGLRFKFTIDVVKEDGTRYTVLDMSENTGDMLASYNVDVQDEIVKVIITATERCANGKYYLASNMIYEVEVFGRKSSIADQAAVTAEGISDLAYLTDGDYETSVLLETAESKIINFKFEDQVDISEMNLVTDPHSLEEGLKYVISYKGEDGQWYEAAEHEDSEKQNNYMEEFAGVILTNEIRLEILNEETVTLKEVEIYKKIYVTDLAKYISKLSAYTGDMTFDGYAGDYDKNAYDALQAKIEEVNSNLTGLNSKKAAEIQYELNQLYIALKCTYVSVDRGELLDTLLTAKDFVKQNSSADIKDLEEAITAAETVYDTYKVTQIQLDEAAVRVQQAMAALEEKFAEVVRLFGKGRYETGYAVADALKDALGVEKFEAVVVATGKNFADALAGSYLAVEKNAPILLTNGKADNIAALHDYIKANVAEGGKVYILGGEGAVPAEAAAIEGYDVVRLSGKSRYDTNLAILKEAGITGDSIIAATGKTFADSLSASAAKLPILLVKPNDTLNDAQKEILAGMKNIYIVGGTGAVSEAYEAELAEFGEVTRVYGKSRYDTSVEVAKTFFGDVNTAVAASGKNFPDGLCGGPLAAALDAPLILTKDGGAAAAAAYVAEKAIKGGYVLGGDGALKDETVVEVFALGSAEEIR